MAKSEFDKSKPYGVVKSDGSIDFFINEEKVGEINVSVHGLNWTYNRQNNEYIKKTLNIKSDIIRIFEGKIKIPPSNEKSMEFTEVIADTKENGFELYYKLFFPEAVNLNSYQVSFSIMLNQIEGQKLVLIGDETQEIIVPNEYSNMELASGMVKEIKVAPECSEGFIVKVDPLSPIWIQDNRAFDSSDIEMRFTLNKHGIGAEIPKEETTEIHLKVKFNESFSLILNEENYAVSNDTRDWVPFVLPHDDAPFDLSYLNEKPAGKHGFLKVEGDQFVFEDGTTAKFWGTCFSASANFPPHEQSEKIAKRLAKFGINIVRTHHVDAGWSRPNIFEFDKEKDNTLEFDPESLDRFDYLIYCLKQEGIYIYLDQLVHRKFKRGDGVDAYEQLDYAAKPYTNFDPRLIELQKKYSYDLWTHINPYTGMAYKDDPAIVLMEFANENDLFTQKVTLEPYRSRLEEKYRKWAQRNNIKIEEEKVDFTKFTEPILRFLHEIQREYYNEMHDYLRSIGVKVPMTGSNWSQNTALLSSLTVNDYTDSHSYWDHPSNSKFSNRPMIGSIGNVFAWLSFNRIYGKPFFVSEWDQPWPNEWRAEHPLAMSAIAAFQGWNGLTVYTYRHSTSIPIDYLSGAFETFNDPARFGLFYHAALIFRRGDVAVGNENIIINVPEKDVFKNLNPWNMPALLATAEKHKLAMSLSEDSAGNRYKYDQQIVDTSLGYVISDTNQLYRNWKERIGTTDTAYTKTAYGFIGEKETIQMNGLKLSIKTPFATVAVSSLTDMPIEESNKILLTAIGRAENTGFKYNIFHTQMLDRGKGPILIEPIEAQIELKNSVMNLSVWAIGPDGTRIKKIKSEKENGYLKFDIGKNAGTMYYLIEASD
ncbi:MAG: hypothetical protein ACUVWN_08270 [bacterium]